MNYLSVVHAIIQENAASKIMIIGDFNTNVNNNAVFGAELLYFCEEHGYIVSDVLELGLGSGAFMTTCIAQIIIRYLYVSDRL